MKRQKRTIKKYERLMRVHLYGANLASMLMATSKKDYDHYVNSKREVRRCAKILGIESPI